MRKQPPENILELYLEDFRTGKYDNPTAWSLAHGWSSAGILRRRAEKSGIELPSRSTCKIDKEIDWNKESDIITGHLLGDGCIICPKKSNVSVLQLTCKYQEYIEWVINKFPMWKDCKFWSLDRFDSRTNKHYPVTWTKTRSSHYLYKLRNEWYPNKVKELPKQFVFTKRSLLIFYLEDGCLSSTGLTLAVHDFSAADILRIQEVVNKTADITTTIHHEHGEPNKIYISRHNLPKFFECIGPCPVRCYTYKWPITLPLS